MLSRVADNLYWMARHIERAEGMSRMIQVRQGLALEYAHNEEQLELFWEPLLKALCAEWACESGEPAGRVVRNLIFSEAASGSIFSSISLARENARMVRDQLSEELWVELNNAYLFFRSGEAEDLYRQGSHQLLEKVIRFSLVFQGLSDAAIPHTEGWRFLSLGKYLERADLTCRMLNTLNLPAKRPTRADLMSVLRGCVALSAYREKFHGNLSLRNVAGFLLFSKSFPRSVRFCLEHTDRNLHAISEVPAGNFSNEAERLTGAALARVNFTDLDNVLEKGLGEILLELQSTLTKIGQEVFETYVLLPSEIKSLEKRLLVERQEQASQQQ